MNNVDNQAGRLKVVLSEYAALPEYSEMETPEIDTKSLFDDYPINIAATRGIIEEITVLVEGGADVNAAGEHGYTPLHNAVEQGHLVAVKFLLAHGSDPAAKNDDGSTPVDLAILLDESEICEYLNQWRE